MVKRNLSWRRYSVLAACVVVGIAGQSRGDGNTDVTFTPPAGAPTGGAGTVGIREVYNGALAGGAINDQDGARANINAPIVGSQVFDYTASMVNILDSGNDGHFGFNSPFKAGTAAVPPPGNGNVDNIAVVIQGTVRIPAAGVYTFGVNSDDGFTLAFDNGAVPFSNPNTASTPTYNGHANGGLTFLGGRGAGDSLGQVTLSAGDHPFVMTYHEGGGGSEAELFAASGAKTSFDSSFALVGATAPIVKRAPFVSGTWSVAAVHGNNSNSLSDAITDLGFVQNNQPVPSRGGGVPVVSPASPTTINYVDPQAANTGGHGPTQNFPGDGTGDDDHFSFGGVATINVTTPGHYTFLTYSDDSSFTRIINPATGKGLPVLTTIGGVSGGVDVDGDGIKDAYANDALDGSGGGCCSDILGTYNLAAGTYVIQTVMNEQGGGSGIFVYGGFGDLGSYDPSTMQLIGENIDTTTPAGLQLVAAPEPGTIALLGIAGIAALARRRRTA